jgi:hypothetical protein
MSTRDDDIEFDFFEDDPATSETAQTRVRLPRRGGGGGNGGERRSLGPPRGGRPLLRLLGLVALAVGVVLAFGLLIESCASSSKQDAYSDYMADVQTIAAQSTANGDRLWNTLNAPLTVQQIEQRLRGLAEQERQNVAQAQDLDPPGQLRGENERLVDALQLRVNGMTGLADTFRSTATDQSDEDAALLAAQSERLLASDIVWSDLFRAAALAQLAEDGVTDVIVPNSDVVDDSELVTTESMQLVLDRVRADTGGDRSGLHGTNIETVVAQPGDQTLVPGDQLNTVTATTELAFEVTVLNSGDSQEVQIPVTLTMEQGTGNPIVKEEQIDVINPDEEVVVTFTDLGEVRFATQTTLKVDVAPVEGERNRDNNSAQYKVTFLLPS